jgi:hypothetical protein
MGFGIWYVTYLAPHVPVNLSCFAMCPDFPDSDYYQDSVAMGFAPFRRSRVPLDSYVLA